VNRADTFKRYLEQAWEQGNLDRLEEFLTEDFVSHSGSEDYGLEAVRTDVELFRAHHPNVHFDVLESLESGDRLVTRLRVHSAAKTAFAIIISRFEGERIAEAWAVWTEFE
jgi:predicted ester cyclase